MSKENPLWGAPRIRGELLKLGFEVAKSTVSKYMIRVNPCPPDQEGEAAIFSEPSASPIITRQKPQRGPKVGSGTPIQEN
jgi:hypothetical protein